MDGQSQSNYFYHMPSDLRQLLGDTVFPALRQISPEQLMYGQSEHARRTDKRFDVPAQLRAYIQLNELYELMYMVKGECLFRLEDNSYHIKAGDACVVGPAMVHYESPSRNNSQYETIWFYHQGIARLNILHCACIATGKYQLTERMSLVSSKSLEQTFESLLKKVLDNSSSAQWQGIRKSWSAVVDQLEKAVTSPENRQRKVIVPKQNWRREALLIKTIEYIEKRYAENVTLNTLSQSASISTAYLEKLFNEYLSTSPLEYLKRLRINKALELLKDAHLNISQICYDVGYADPLYFSRVFRAFTGYSPRHYRDKFIHEKREMFF